MRSLFVKSKQPTTSLWLWVLLVLALGLAWVLHSIESLQLPRLPDLSHWTAQDELQPPAAQAAPTPPGPMPAEPDQAPATPSTPEVASEAPAKDSEGDAIDQQVQAFVGQWATHWSARNLDGYLSSYAEGFQPENKKSLAEWRQERKQRILSKSKITVQIRDFMIVSSDHAGLKVHFTQIYEADGLRNTGPKVLMLSKLDGNWKILREYAP